MLHSRSNKIRIKNLWLTYCDKNSSYEQLLRKDGCLYLLQKYASSLRGISICYKQYIFEKISIHIIWVIFKYFLFLCSYVQHPHANAFPTQVIKIGKSKKFGMLGVFRTLHFGYYSYKSPGCTFCIHFYRINKNGKADCPCRPSKMLQNAADFLEVCIWILSLLIIAFLYSWYVNHVSNIFYVNF